VSGGWLTQDGDAVVVRIRVTPRAGRDRIDEIRGDRLHMRVAAAPADGAANESVRRLLARETGIAKTRIELVRGAKNREKDFRLQGATTAEIREAIGEDR
jgi:uncharacterized protein (TIGR00251 family)